VRGGRLRRDGLHLRVHRSRLRAGCRRGPDQGVLPGGLEHGGVRDHGHRAPDQASRSLREDGMTAHGARADTGAAVQTRAPARNDVRSLRIPIAILIVLALIAPFVVYPVFLMKMLCWALFALAFNLLIGYVGLLSFGHALFFGGAAYLTAHAAKEWGLPFELAVAIGTVTGALLGLVVGWLAIRRQGIYFAMITLALAQMFYFFCLRA